MMLKKMKAIATCEWTLKEPASEVADVRAKRAATRWATRAMTPVAPKAIDKAEGINSSTVTTARTGAAHDTAAPATAKAQSAPESTQSEAIAAAITEMAEGMSACGKPQFISSVSDDLRAPLAIPTTATVSSSGSSHVSSFLASQKSYSSASSFSTSAPAASSAASVSESAAVQPEQFAHVRRELAVALRDLNEHITALNASSRVPLASALAFNGVTVSLDIPEALRMCHLVSARLGAVQQYVTQGMLESSQPSWQNQHQHQHQHHQHQHQPAQAEPPAQAVRLGQTVDSTSDSEPRNASTWRPWLLPQVMSPWRHKFDNDSALSTPNRGAVPTTRVASNNVSESDEGGGGGGGGGGGRRGSRQEPAAQCGVIYLDCLSKQCMWTDDTRRLFGVSTAHSSVIPLADFFLFICSDDRARITKAVSMLCSSPIGQMTVDYFRLYRPDGTLRLIRLSLEIHHILSGGPGVGSCVLGLLEDTTDSEADTDHERANILHDIKQKTIPSTLTQLRFSERTLQLAVDAAKVGVMIYDLQNPEQSIGSSHSRFVWGFGPNEAMTSERMLLRVHPDDRTQLLRIKMRLMDPNYCGPPIDWEARVIHPDGGIHWLRGTGNVYRDQQLPPLSICVHCDVTKEKELQQALESSLKQAQAASTYKSQFISALSHELRAPLNPMTLILNSLMERVAVASLPQGPSVHVHRKHSTKEVEPLNLHAELASDLQTLWDCVTMETALVDDLLDVTRIAAGKLHFTKTILDVHDMMQDTIKACMASMPSSEQGVRILYQPKAIHAHCAADAIRLKQVFWNILRNAVKFTPITGRITITTYNRSSPQLQTFSPPATAARSVIVNRGNITAIGATKEAAERAATLSMNLQHMKENESQTTETVTLQHPELVVVVRDDGAGMDANQMSGLFQAFNQGGTSITKQFGGLGLGLSIAGAITALHNATIVARSDGPGTGSTFTFAIQYIDSESEPCLDKGKQASMQFQPTSSDSLLPTSEIQGPSVDFGALRVLLVDDDSTTLRLMKRTLKRFGIHTIHTAQTVQESIAVIKNLLRLQQDQVTADMTAMASESPFDLLLSDMGLPDGNGLDIMMAVQRLCPTCTIPGLVCSGYGTPADIAASTKAGFYAHLVKPISPPQLKSAIIAACHETPIHY